MKKRDLFSEMMQGVKDMTAHREGKITLREFEVESSAPVEISAEEIVAIREKMQMSQAVFARRVHVKTNTLRNWERNKSQPNEQAAVLLKLVDKYPDMIERLASVK